MFYRKSKRFGDDAWTPPDFTPPSNYDVPMAPLDYNLNLQPVAGEGVSVPTSTASPWAALAGAVIGATVAKVAKVPATVGAPRTPVKTATSSYLPWLLIGGALLFSFGGSIFKRHR